MQKRYLVIFSLLLISILFISGCQYSAIGGNLKLRPSYSATDSTYSSTKFGSPSVHVDLTACQNGDYRGASYVYVDFTCYRVKGCVNVMVLSSGLETVPYQSKPITSTKTFNRELPVLVSINEISCAQTSKGSVPKMTHEQAMQDGAMFLY